MQDSVSSQAFMKAYDQYADAIYRHCYFRVSDSAIAEDIMQETFMRVWDYMRQGKDVENMRALLYHVAHNLIVNHYKKKKSVSLDVLQEDGFEPASSEHVDTDVFSAEDIARHLAGVDPETRTLLIMRYVDELGPADIAELTGLTENVISVRLHRGLKKLRTLLHDE
jgi:RNA polymerase sigma-70 factor, ECF subfamily